MNKLPILCQIHTPADFRRVKLAGHDVGFSRCCKCDRKVIVSARSQSLINGGEGEPICNDCLPDRDYLPVMLSAGGNYEAKVMEKMAAGVKYRGRIHTLDIRHDNWCDFTAGRGPCNCNPDVSDPRLVPMPEDN
jgi:hypothetical protein